jgi:hypothetical protein
MLSVVSSANAVQTSMNWASFGRVTLPGNRHIIYYCAICTSPPLVHTIGTQPVFSKYALKTMSHMLTNRCKIPVLPCEWFARRTAAVRSLGAQVTHEVTHTTNAPQREKGFVLYSAIVRGVPKSGCERHVSHLWQRYEARRGHRRHACDKARCKEHKCYERYQTHTCAPQCTNTSGQKGSANFPMRRHACTRHSIQHTYGRPHGEATRLCSQKE